MPSLSLVRSLLFAAMTFAVPLANAVIIVNDSSDTVHACATTGTGTGPLRDACH